MISHYLRQSQRLNQSIVPSNSSIPSIPFLLDHVEETGHIETTFAEHSISKLDEPIAIRKGTQECIKHHISHHVSYTHLSPSFRAFVTSITEEEIPKSIHEALGTPKWRDAAFEELRSLQQNETWELTNLPKGKHLVGSMWIFTIKYKARLVDHGFTQTYGLDYEETFTPVA